MKARVARKRQAFKDKVLSRRSKHRRPIAERQKGGDLLKGFTEPRTASPVPDPGHGTGDAADGSVRRRRDVRRRKHGRQTRTPAPA
jgi:hypothetical protein